MYRSSERVNETFERFTDVLNPEYDFIDGIGVRHTLYLISDEGDIEKIVDAFKGVEAFYIADGHHRAAAASRAREWLRSENPNHTGEEEYNYFLGVVFPHDRLRVFEYNRVVKDLNGLQKGEFLEEIRERFHVEPAVEKPYRPKRVHEFGMYLGKEEWYVLKPKEGTFREDHPVERLDVSILQNNLLSPILGIENPRTDPRIDFVPAVYGLGDLVNYVDEKGWAVGFTLHPTPVEAIMEVADAGMTMPPKSTWFDPKLKSGVIVHLI